jgi:diguanylate cyclase (GGDEF)-like protein
MGPETMIASVRDFFARRHAAAQAPMTAIGVVTQAVPLRRLWWAAIVLLGLSATAVIWTIWQLRNDAIRAAIADSGNIASVLANQLSSSVQSIDTVLLEIKKTVQERDVGTPAGIRTAFDNHDFQESLLDDRARLPQVFNITVTDKNGQLVVSTVDWPVPNLNVADRDYFQTARSRRSGELSISIPSANRINGKQTIIFARRIEDSAGNFAGIVFASVDTKYLEDIYGAIQSVHSLLFTLLNPDGIILFRHPDEHNSTGQALSNRSAWLDALSHGDGDEGFRVLGLADGNVRFVSIRKVPEYPLIVDVSVTESTSLASWRQRAGAIGVGSLVFLLFSIYLLRAMTRQVRLLSMSEASLAQKSRLLDAALNNMSQGLTMFDDQKRLIVSNAEFQKISGLTADLLKPGTPLASIVEARIAAKSALETAPTILEKSLEQAAQNGSSQSVYTLQDGRTVSVTRKMMNGGGWVSIHQDITAQKIIEAQLARMASYDALTGLANRMLLMEKIGDAVARSRRHGEPFAVLMLDLDRFKTVNDSLGHPAGDALLKEVARRLRQATREVDCVARLGGDEFAVLQVLEKGQTTGVIALADRILQAIVEPYDLDGRKLSLETSIGIALAPQDGSEADALIKHADLALYKAKSEGRNRYCFFEPAMEAQARESRELEDDLRKAIARHEFELHYQTIVDLEYRRCGGVEALVRWRHPERGLIRPDQFIPLAEESGLIVPLGQWILQQACTDAVAWPANLRVAVNLSPVQFKHGDLLGVLKSTLDATGLPPQRLVLEITETVLLENNAANIALLHDIKKLGVSVVLDDFGIGYSSMTYLQTFPFDGIKIDQSFIQTMTDHAGAAIVCAIAGLGRSLDMATTAEGVETMEQLTFLRAAGCRYAQGYLLSHPVPLAELSFELPPALSDGLKAA